MRRGEINFLTMMVGLLIAGLAIGMVGIFTTSFSADYQGVENITNNDTWDQLNRQENLSATVDDVEALITGDTGGLTDFGPVDEIFSVGFSSLRLLLNIPANIYYVMNVALGPGGVGLPAEVAAIVVGTILTLFVAIAFLIIIQAVTKIT